VNLELIRQEAKKAGSKSISLKAWGNRTLYTGEAPTRRAA
jgi:hypothetical protein